MPDRLEDFSVALRRELAKSQRLYRIKLLQRSGDGWKTRAAFQDLHDREVEQIYEEVLTFLEGQEGTWKMEILYWKGPITTPVARRHLSLGENFLYDSNPRGDVIEKHEPSLEIDLDK